MKKRPEPVAPYRFYPVGRFCPRCGERLVATAPVTREFMRPPLQRLGVTCLCMGCGARYRAFSFVRYVWLAWAGAAGRWLWWQTTRLESTTVRER